MKKIKVNFEMLLPYICGGVLLVFILAYQKIKAAFERGKNITQTIENVSKPKAEIQGSNIQIDLDTLASAIYYSFFTADGKKRWNEDEQTALLNIERCPADLIKSLQVVYATKFGRILKDDLISKLSNKQWETIKNLF